MRIAIIGVGAIGCLIAARLGTSGHPVTLIAHRQATVRAIRAEGLEVTSPEGLVTRHEAAVTDDPLSIGQQDLVILCVKAYSLSGVLGTLSQLIGLHTAIVPVLSGIPWWYPSGPSASLAGLRLASLDADGSLAAAIPVDRVVGAVTSVAAESLGIGRVHHVHGGQFQFGLPVPKRTAVAPLRSPPTPGVIAGAFRASGFRAAAVRDVRMQVWANLMGILALYPLSVLTEGDPASIFTEPALRGVALRMMGEAQTVADRLGVRSATSTDDQLAAAAVRGRFRTPMRQDDLSGRRLELDAILGAVIELADRVGVDVPTLRRIHDLTDQRARNCHRRNGKFDDHGNDRWCAALAVADGLGEDRGDT